MARNTRKPPRKNGAATPKNNRSKRTIPATRNVSNKVFAGNAIRSRDEYFYGGKPKPDKTDKPDEMYRKAYVIETNNLDELAVVKSTTSKGHYLNLNPTKNSRLTFTYWITTATRLKLVQKVQARRNLSEVARTI